MIKVMIADDNTAFNFSCCNILTKDKSIQIVSNTTDGITTLQEYKIVKPDVLLLDLGLPLMNGLDVINNLCLDNEEKRKTNIIVISSNAPLRYNLFNTSKVFRILPKPIDFDELLFTIKEIVAENEPKQVTNKEIRSFLFTLNFNLYADGTIYLIDAICLGFKDPSLLRNMKDLYTIVAQLHSVSPTSVKWGIRNSIDTMNHNTTQNEINKKFNIQYDRKMTPKFFIPLVISHFQKD